MKNLKKTGGGAFPVVIYRNQLLPFTILEKTPRNPLRSQDTRCGSIWWLLDAGTGHENLFQKARFKMCIPKLFWFSTGKTLLNSLLGVAENRWKNEELRTFLLSPMDKLRIKEGCLLQLTSLYHSRTRNCRGGSPRSPLEELLGWGQWFNICSLKNGPLWKRGVFWRPSFSRCCWNFGEVYTQCQSPWSLWIWLKTNVISGLHDFDHIYVHIYVQNSGDFELLFVVCCFALMRQRNAPAWLLCIF